MKKLAASLMLLSSLAWAVPGPVIWGPGNAATVIPPVLNVKSISITQGSSTPQTSNWTSPTSMTGTAAIAAGTGIVGTGTKFTSELHIGDSVTIATETKQIATITSDTAATVTAAFTGTSSGNAITRVAVANAFVYPNGVFQSGGTRTSVPYVVANMTGGDLNFLGAESAAGASDATSPTAYGVLMGYRGASTGNGGVLMFGRARGTEAAPSAVISGDSIGALQWAGAVDGSAMYTGVTVTAAATETYSSSAGGTKLTVITTPNTTHSRTVAAVFGQDQSLSVNGDYRVGGASSTLLFSKTAPTIASGGCTSPSVVNNNGTMIFTINVGSSCSGSQPIVLTLPTAANGWGCRGEHRTTATAAANIVPTATSTTSVTLTNVTGGTTTAVAWTSSEILQISCLAY